jgi:energy-coupling factor transport system ATP-binding protein
MREAAISFEDVHYKYSGMDTWVLNNFNIEIPLRSVWLVVGPTGSGKSTFLYLTRGFHKEYGGDFDGRIYVKGYNLADLDFYTLGRKGIGCVGQDPSLNLHQLTVREEILSSPIYYNLPWDECIGLANEIIESFGLSDLVDKSPMDLSGGEMQRVAIAATLAMAKHLKGSDYGILLLDEPDSFLDSKGKKELIEILKRLQGFSTIVIATHRFEQYLDIADGITIISEGKNVLTGKPREVLYSEVMGRIIGYPFAIQVARELQQRGIISSNPITGEELSLEIREKIKAKPNKEFYTPKNRSNIVVYENLSYCYPNGSQAIYQLNGAIPKSSITAIIGNNGSGKTTLAKLTLNLLDKYTGTITLLEKDLKLYNRIELSQNVSYIAQIPKDMFVSDTVRRECELIPRFQGNSDFREHAIKAIKKAGLEQYIDNPVDTLSGGQSRLLSIAMTAFMTEAPLIILDEPEFGIDPKTWNMLFHFFSGFRENGKTVVMLTHTLDITLFCDHVIVMNNGKIVKAGHPFEIYEDKQLISEINLNRPSLYPLFRFIWANGRKPTDIKSFLKVFLTEVL